MGKGEQLGAIVSATGGHPAADIPYVPTFAALRSYLADQASNGLMVYVQELDQYATLDRSSTLTDDGITVVAAVNGGRWLRRAVPTPKWQAQATWYIDPTNGADTNDGSTSTTALKTYAELIRRLGVSPYVASPVDIYLLGDLPATDPVVLKNPTVLATGYIYLHGTLTAVDAGGTYTSSTSRAAASNTPCKVTDTTRNTWTVGQMIKNMAGTAGSIGAYAWVLNDLGSNQARLTPLAKVDATTLSPVTEVNPTNGDTYVLYTPSKIGAFDIAVSTPALASTSTLLGKVIFENLNLVSSSSAPVQQGRVYANYLTALRFAGCLFSGGSSVLIGGCVDFQNCLFNSGTVRVVSADSSASTAARFTAGGTLVAFIVQGGAASLAGGWTASWTVNGGAIQVINKGWLNVTDAGAFDWSTAVGCAIQTSADGTVNFGSFSVAGKFWGVSANSNTAVLNLRSGRAIVPDATKLTCAGALTATQDFSIQGAASGPAMDVANASTAPYTAARNYTFALLAAAVGSSGFGGNAINPASGVGIVKEI